MYHFMDHIRIKTCDELSFLVNIRDNSFFVIKTKTLRFLELRLKEGLTIDKLSNDNSGFIDFIKELEKQNILGDTIDEI